MPKIVDPNAPRTNLGCLLLFVPLFLLGGVVIAYGYLWIIGVQGRVADGDRIIAVYEACAAAQPIVEARVATMGLGDPVFTSTSTGFQLTATLPSDPNNAQAIPHTLTRTGALTIEDMEGNIIIPAEQVDATSVHAGAEGMVTLVRLDPKGTVALRDHMRNFSRDQIRYRLDGEQVFERFNLPPEENGNLEIPVEGPDETKQLVIAAERSVIIGDGPLPCAIRLLSVDKAGKI